MKRPLVVMLIVLAGCVGWVIYQQSDDLADSASPGAVEGGVGLERYGNPDAPIKIEAYYPVNEGHQFIVDYLREFTEARPDQVSLVIYDTQTRNGREHWATTGLECAGVFINGQSKHEIATEEGTRTVHFIKRMGVFWTEEDLEALVEQLLQRGGNAAQTGRED